MHKRFDYIDNRFRNKLVRDITETNPSELYEQFLIVNFRNETQKSIIHANGHMLTRYVFIIVQTELPTISHYSVKE